MASGYHLLQDSSLANGATVLGGGAWANSTVSGSGFVPGAGPGGSLPSCAVLPANATPYIPVNGATGLNSSSGTVSFGAWFKVNPAGGATVIGYDTTGLVFSISYDSGTLTFADDQANTLDIDVSAVDDEWFMAGFSAEPDPDDVFFTKIVPYVDGVAGTPLTGQVFVATDSGAVWRLSRLQNTSANGTPSICGIHGEAGVTWGAAQFANIYNAGLSYSATYQDLTDYEGLTLLNEVTGDTPGDQVSATPTWKGNDPPTYPLFAPCAVGGGQYGAGPTERAVDAMATLVSPHWAISGHAPGTGQNIRFLKSDNTVVEVDAIGLASIRSGVMYAIRFGVDVEALGIPIMKCGTTNLARDATQYLAFEADRTCRTLTVANVAYGYCSWGEIVFESGDSNKPVIVVYDGEPVLLALIYTAVNAPLVHYSKSEINALLALDSEELTFVGSESTAPVGMGRPITSPILGTIPTSPLVKSLTENDE